MQPLFNPNNDFIVRMDIRVEGGAQWNESEERIHLRSPNRVLKKTMNSGSCGDGLI